MKAHKTVSKVLPFLLFLGSGLTGASAASLLLDFGPTAITSAVATTSPAHAAGAVPSTEISWNTGLIADTSTLVYSDGTAATGVSITLGRSSGGSTSNTVNLADKTYLNNALGTAENTGIYAANCPARDGIYGGSGSANAYAMGCRIDGLPAGNYIIYCTGRNCNTTGATPEEFYAFTGASATTFTFSMAADVYAAEANSSPATTASFVAANNYCVLAVTISAGQSLFVASVGTSSTEYRGFMNSIEIVPGGTPAKIAVQPPASQTVLQGIFAVSISAQVQGTQPIYMQWLSNSVSLAGATNSTLTLSNVTTSMAANYSLYVTNAYGSDLSSNSVLVVTPVTQTGVLSNLWTLLPGDRVYVTSTATNNERGLAFNPATSSVLMACRWPSNIIAVLDAQTGAEKRFLDADGIPGYIPSVGAGMNLIGVADDGAVYVSSLTANAGSGAFIVYRWDDDSGTNTYTEVFSGDPAVSVQPNLRWGDNFTVRGAGADTQILLAPSSGTNVVLLQTASGLDFQTEVPPVVIGVSGVPSGFAQFGTAFGPGTNTFWAKTWNNQLYLVQFDLVAATGAVLHAYTTSQMPGTVGPIGANNGLKLVAGLSLEMPDNVRLYNVSDLNIGPLLVDQGLFTVKNVNNVLGGTGAAAFGQDYLFVLDSNNGVKAFLINTNAVIPARITGQPASQTVLEGIASLTLNSAYQGTPPVFSQWRFDGTDIDGATNISLTLSNLTASMAGSYSLFVSNAYGTDLSSNALVTLIPVLSTPQMTNIWDLLPGAAWYLGSTGNYERGLAYDGFANDLLLVSREQSADNVVVLDPATGVERYLLNVSGVAGDLPGTSLGLNMVGVGDDGVVYAGSVTVAASSTPYYLYQWADDTSNSAPNAVFIGDPAGSVQPNLRWGDNLAVRGAGTNTQILLAPGSGTNVVLLETLSGYDFQTEVQPAVIAVSGVPSGFADLGLAFGPGTNTFWAKTAGGQLYLVQFDLNASTGAVLYAYATNAISASVRGIGVDSQQKWLAGVELATPDNVHLYDISNPATGPVLRDQALFATMNPNTVVGGAASTSFGGNYLFALDSNNGIKAFLIDTNYVPSLSPFSITSIQAQDGQVVLTWPSVAGHSYQVQFKNSLSGTWSNTGPQIVATTTNISSTNSLTGAAQFYRVQGQ